jgi:hypothetical protein
MASMGCGASAKEKDARPDAPAPPAAVSFSSSSTKEFHSPQAGHFPSHFGESWPQLRQKKAVRDFFVGDLFVI